jgi:hypothetical protein
LKNLKKEINMIDSRAKGRNAEIKCRDELRKHTGLMWERTPMSGALDAKHMMKGDVYVPQKVIKYCVEVKHYKDDHISTQLLTSTNPQFKQWWAQTIREAEQMEKEPLLIFKHNRSKWFAAFTDYDVILNIVSRYPNLMLGPEDICICLLADFCAEAEFE